MRITGLTHVSQFRQKYPGGSAIEATPDAPVNIELRPTTDEEKLNQMKKDWLAVLRARGYSWIGIQNMTFKIGDDCRYTPDFVVLASGRLVAYETKGFLRDDALVKLKTAARQFSWLLIIKVERKNGNWIETEIKP